MASGGLAGASSLAFVYSLDYARTRLANDAKSAKKGGERQFNGLVDVYRKTLASDGIGGLYRGFSISCVGIIVYRGLYFGLFDSIKPVLLTGAMEDSFLAAFLLGWGVTIGAGVCVCVCEGSASARCISCDWLGSFGAVPVLRGGDDGGTGCSASEHEECECACSSSARCMR